MSRAQLFLINDTGVEERLCEVRDKVVLGREPDGDDGVRIQNGAISRNHGLLKLVRGTLLYKDQGSTNGSWVNGATAAAGRWFILRDGALLQLADSAMRVRFIDVNPSDQPYLRFLIVLQQDEVVSEYPIPDYGRALVVGGKNGDLDIQGELTDAPSLIVERLGLNISAVPGSTPHGCSLNGESINHPVTVRDGDEIKVWAFSVLVSDQASAPALSPAVALDQDLRETSGSAVAAARPPLNDPNRSIKDWDEEDSARRAIGTAGGTSQMSGGGFSSPRAPTNPRFGQPSSADQYARDQAEETVMLDPDQLKAAFEGIRGRGAAGGNPADDDSSGYSLSTVEDKLIIFILVGLMLAVLACVIWFLLFR